MSLLPSEARKEIAADQFAMALLMPRKFIEKELNKYMRNRDSVLCGKEANDFILHIAKTFEVDTGLMKLRLIQLGYSLSPNFFMEQS